VAGTWRGASLQNGRRAQDDGMVVKKKLAAGDECALGRSSPAAGGDKARIESDIRQFHENVVEVPENDETRDVIELARQYCEDTKYFLGKKDYVTAFGCINYAHGLIDAYRKKWRD